MSQQLINAYLSDLDRYKKISGSLTEGVISEAFKDLLKNWSRQPHLTLRYSGLRVDLSPWQPLGA